MKPTKGLQKTQELVIPEVKRRYATFCILGENLIMHRYSWKAQQELLYPPGPRNAAELAANLKHDPIEEFRACVYKSRPENQKQTLIHIPSEFFKGAIANAALDVPGAAKTQIGRLTTITDVHIPVYGVPEVFTKMVKLSGPSRTPDVRTRAIFREFACTVTIGYLALAGITENNIAQLLAMAGLIVGLGDWRPQKGGSYGQFSIVDADNERFQRVCKLGTKAQQKALDSPVYYDDETERLLLWFEQELVRREKDKDRAPVEAKTNGRRMKRERAATEVATNGQG